ncbi:MAG: LD-carboxypeptidase [Sediminibacterium sp.]|nr:LD-carboxypeptidase [Sediminibacterium sp.]
MIQKIIQPPYLKTGDVVAFVAPSSNFDKNKLAKAVSYFESKGLKVEIGATVSGKYNYFSGTDQERLQELQYYFDNPNIKAIFCVRGGYGLSRIVDQIDFQGFVKKPKWLIGFSDVCVLHWHIYSCFNMATLHAPMANAFNQNETYYIETIFNALFGGKVTYKSYLHDFQKTGKVIAPVIGGNLAIITHLIGTKSFPNIDGKILFLEDVGEYLYNIDRMCWQLSRNGIFKKISGLIWGGFSQLKDTNEPFGKTIYEILAEHSKDVNGPVAYNFPISHEVENVSIKMGFLYELDVSPEQVILHEI